MHTRGGLPMGTIFAVAIALLSFVPPPFVGCARSPAPQADFQPAKVVSVSDVTIPADSVAMGTVVLQVSISKEGEIRGVNVRRDIPGETDVAVRSLRAWKFEPARLNGRAVDSKITIAVTFNPAPPVAADLPLPPLRTQGDETGTSSHFVPPEVLHASFPKYPVKALEPRTVILQLVIGPNGEVQHRGVVRDAPPFTTSALKAIEDWRFAPATMNGEPVDSSVVLAFCFRAPVIY